MLKVLLAVVFIVLAIETLGWTIAQVILWLEEP